MALGVTHRAAVEAMMTCPRQKQARDKSSLTRVETAAWSSLGLLAVFGSWTAVTMLGLVPPEFLPTPAEVLRTLVAELTTEKFSGALLQVHALASLQKFGLSYLLAVVLGVSLGLIMGRYRYVDWLVSPIFDAVRFIPPIAWVPFSILWFGTGLLAPTMIVFMAAFAPCVVNAQRGVHLMDPVLAEAARTLGAGPLITFRRVLLPAAMPQIIAGMRIGAGLGWQSLVGAELIVGNTGLGYAMTQSTQNLDTPTLVVCMLAIGLTGAAIDYTLAHLESRARKKRGLK